MDTAALIFYVASTIAQWVVGRWWKKKEETTNELIPMINGIGTAIAAVGLVLLLDVPIKDAVIAALGAMWTSIAGYEGAKGMNKKVAIGAPLFVLIAASGLLVANPANAQQRVHTYGGPSFIASAYSSDDTYINNEDAPNLRARVGASIDMTKQLDVIGPFLVQPQVAFVWMARRWPVGAESSPIGENNEYRPELMLDLTPGGDWSWLGVALKEIRLSPWAHASNGQAADQYSASLDMAKLAPVFEWRGWLVTLEGWYLYGFGTETAGIVNYANFKNWVEAGGALEVERTVKLGADVTDAGGEVLRTAPSFWIKGRFTLTSQDVEMVVPLADYFNFGVYLWAHNGELDGIVDYANDHFAGGVGMALSLE